jgi:hypothetical protein
MNGDILEALMVIGVALSWVIGFVAGQQR